MKFKEQRKELAQFMRRLYDRKLTTASGGNISLRIGNMVIISPSGKDKATIISNDIAILQIDGKLISKNITPSVETSMHLAIYNMNENVKAIIHAHPTTASAFTAMKTPINTKLIEESYVILDVPLKLNYAQMGSETLAQQTAKACQTNSCLLLENHGVLCTGKTLFEAYDKIEVLEEAAKLTLITNLLNDINPLKDNHIEAINQLLNR
jgi:L-fuculose-phosphate aldolase